MPHVRPALLIQFINPIQVELVKVDIEIDGATEALDQRDDASLGLCFFESSFFAKVA